MLQQGTLWKKRKKRSYLLHMCRPTMEGGRPDYSTPWNRVSSLPCTLSHYSTCSMLTTEWSSKGLCNVRFLVVCVVCSRSLRLPSRSTPAVNYSCSLNCLCSVWQQSSAPPVLTNITLLYLFIGCYCTTWAGAVFVHAFAIFRIVCFVYR